MGKCAKCTKSVSKKNPGLQCNKCNKWQHGTCASLTTEQLSALSGSDSIDWKCRQCMLVTGSKPKRISVILPDPEEEESDAETGSGEQEKLLVQIRHEVREMRKTVRDIIREELQISLSFFSNKIDEYEEKLKDYETRLRLMENQCKEISNTCRNLLTVNGVLEQKLSKMEQAQCSNDVEICGMREKEKEDVKLIVQSYCQVINQQPQDILRVYRKRKPSSTGSAQAARAMADSPIVVTLREGCRTQWLAAAKTKATSARDLGGDSDTRIVLRESLTPSTAFLLWKTKCELKEKSLCQYVWCKNGVIMVRKVEGDKKIHYVRTTSDIERISKELKK